MTKKILCEQTEYCQAMHIDKRNPFDTINLFKNGNFRTDLILVLRLKHRYYSKLPLYSPASAVITIQKLTVKLVVRCAGAVFFNN